jgi:HAD superfamily phosphatase (TIGR01668 family)
LLECFRPSLWLKSIYEIRPENLTEAGIRGVILDLDNTLVNWGSETGCDRDASGIQQARTWISSLTSCGLKVCIVSNNAKKRVAAFADSLGVPALAKARKPRRKAFLTAMQLMSTTPADTVCIGDQVLTDVFGANRLGLSSILVSPMDKHEFIGTRIARIIESLILSLLQRKGRIRISDFPKTSR